jgi:adenine-specific DNA-methyltransferase
LGNYHIWETLVRWDRPEAYGTARKRIGCREYSSPFNSKPRILDALTRLLESLRCKHLVVSFSNEGYVRKEDLLEVLEQRGHVQVATVDFKRYVGAQIGIYNPSGEKVGKISHLRNKEYLFIVSNTRSMAERAALAAQGDTAAQLDLL